MSVYLNKLNLFSDRRLKTTALDSMQYYVS